MNEKDLLDQINVTPGVFQRWNQLVAEKSKELLNSGAMRPESIRMIPDEKAIVQKDGSLKLFVQLPQGLGEVSMRVEASEWSYRH